MIRAILEALVNPKGQYALAAQRGNRRFDVVAIHLLTSE
jgi:hypothetical protein